MSTHKLNSTWVVWYHNPCDINWDIDSYKLIYEFNTIEQFWTLKNSWESCLPNIGESMFFLMRKKDDDEYIYPMWEDKNNRDGGCWSFKIPQNMASNIWHSISMFLIGETLCSKSLLVNGISISPKKKFCIIKIWNKDKNFKNISLINSEVDTIDKSHSLYKAHIDNIALDKQKKNKYYNRSYSSSNNRNTRNRRFNRRF